MTHNGSLILTRGNWGKPLFPGRLCNFRWPCRIQNRNPGLLVRRKKQPGPASMPQGRVLYSMDATEVGLLLGRLLGGFLRAGLRLRRFGGRFRSRFRSFLRGLLGSGFGHVLGSLEGRLFICSSISLRHPG